MRRGLSDGLRRRLRHPDGRDDVYCDLIARFGGDVRGSKAQWQTASLTDVTANDAGGISLTEGTPTDAEFTTFTTAVEDLYPAFAPWRALIWELDATIGALARLSSVTFHLTRNLAGSGDDFDGDFGVQLYTLHQIRSNNGTIDLWQPVMLSEPITKPASTMTTDTEDVVFTFPESVPIGQLTAPLVDPTSPFDPAFPIIRRWVIAIPLAYAGSNQNCGVAVDAGADNDEAVTGGTFHHRSLTWASPPRAAWWQVDASVTGMLRGGFSVHSYPTSGTAVFDGADIVSLGAAAQGEISFVVKPETPSGTAVTAYARVDSGDPWTEILDGQTPTDVGLAIPNPVEYEMMVELESNAAGDTTPTVRELGFEDRVAFVLNDPKTNLARLEGFEDRIVDVMTGQVQVSEGRCVIQRDGNRDFRDIGTMLLSERDTVDLELRVYRGHPDVDRTDWLHLNTYLVDDYESTLTEHALVCVDVRERLKGEYPQESGQLFGYLLKAATAHVTGGSHQSDFNRELSVDEETAGTIAVSIAGSSTEDSRGVASLGVPSDPDWPPGDWTVKVEVTVANANISLQVAIARLNAAGVDAQVSPFSASQSLASTGVKTFFLSNLAWTAGSATDLLGVIYRFTNANGASQSVTIRTGTVNTEVIPPWIATQGIEPAVLAGTVAEVYDEWMTGVVGLQGRFIGDLPTSTEDVQKAVADADGLEELSRIALIASPNAGFVIASQGRVHFRSGYGSKVVALDRMPLVPYEETASDEPLSPGLKGRAPYFEVPYAYQGDVPDDFAQIWRATNADALAAFGRSRIDNPTLRLDDETAKYVRHAGHASRIAQPIVQALAWGKTIFPLKSTIGYPEAELLDPVAFETETYVRRNPVTDEPILGRMWVVGLIVGVLNGRRGHAFDGDRFLVWVRNPTDFYRTSASVAKRQMFEPPVVEIDVQSNSDQPENAIIRLRVFPDDADVYWYYHDATATIPPRNDPRWTLWDGEDITLPRDPTDTMVFSAFASLNGFQGQEYWRAIPPDSAPTVVELAASESGAGPYTVTVTATVTPRVRSIQWFQRVHAADWPTVGGGEDDPTDITYFTTTKGVITGKIGRDSSGNAIAGGLTLTVTGLSAGNRLAVVAVPVDATGYVRPFPNDQRATLAYTVAGSPSGSLTAIDYTLDRTGTSCSVLRRYDFTWTPDATVTDSYELRIYVRLNGGTRTLIATNTSPDSDNTEDDVEVSAYEGGAHQPTITVDLEFELYNGSTVLVQSGPIGDQDFFEGSLCPL